MCEYTQISGEWGKDGGRPVVLNLPCVVLNALCVVLNLLCVVSNLPRVVLNVTHVVLNVTHVVLNVTHVVPNVPYVGLSPSLKLPHRSLGLPDLSLKQTRGDKKVQVRYGVLPPPGLEPAGTDLTKAPAAPEELPIVFATKRKKDIINFNPNDSGKTAYFDIRIENGTGEYGPWCPLFHAIVP